MFSCFLYLFFFFKHKTAYEMRISDWSSDVCSSDLSSRRRGCGASPRSGRPGRRRRGRRSAPTPSPPCRTGCLGSSAALPVRCSSGAGGRRSSWRLSVAEIGVERVERVAAARDPFEIVLARRADAIEHCAQSGCLGPVELAVGNVELVDQLADRGQCRIIEAGAQHQRLEAAAILLMGELGIGHVEPELARLGHIRSEEHTSELQSLMRISYAV